ncbi:hypothetical protein ACGFZS_46875 [Streptomyces sp. NPDC048288]|uniref:hypothetical protein n=1 Tax=Streptomyces sp. NPDC048288 TaxID=3365529 RepID=UPI00371F800D
MMVDIATRIVTAVGAVFAAYGVVGILSGRMERWMACGFLAVSAFIAGLNYTAAASYQWAALNAGFTAMNTYVWWHGGGEKQVAQLRRHLGRKDGAR